MKNDLQIDPKLEQEFFEAYGIDKISVLYCSDNKLKDIDRDCGNCKRCKKLSLIWKYPPITTDIAWRLEEILFNSGMFIEILKDEIGWQYQSDISDIDCFEKIFADKLNAKWQCTHGQTRQEALLKLLCSKLIVYLCKPAVQALFKGGE